MIELENVTKVYRMGAVEVYALREVTLSIKNGEMVSVIGASGSGKSTVCELLTNEDSCTVLHDDIVAISQKEGRFHAWSTPQKEDIPVRRSIDAPLQAVFFLKQDQSNYATRLSGREAARLLTLNFIPPMVAKEGSLGIAPAESLGILFALAERIPCYELHFRREPHFWECIPQFVEKESVAG